MNPRVADGLRVDRDIAIRDAGSAFDRGDRDGEVRCFERARCIDLQIYEVEARAERLRLTDRKMHV